MLLYWGTQAKTLVSPLPSNIQPAATIWCSYRYGGADGCCCWCLSRDSIARLVGHVDAGAGGVDSHTCGVWSHCHGSGDGVYHRDVIGAIIVMYANGVACAAGAGSKSRLRTAERESNVALNFLNRIPMPDITSPEDCFGYSARKPEVSPRS